PRPSRLARTRPPLPGDAPGPERRTGSGPRPALVVALLLTLVAALILGLWLALRPTARRTAHADHSSQAPRLSQPGDGVLLSGEEAAVSVQVDRGDCKGPLELRMQGLPADVDFDPVLLPAGDKTGTLTLTLRARPAVAAATHRVQVT